jgi:hypothetical protein
LFCVQAPTIDHPRQSALQKYLILLTVMAGAQLVLARKDRFGEPKQDPTLTDLPKSLTRLSTICPARAEGMAAYCRVAAKAEGITDAEVNESFKDLTAFMWLASWRKLPTDK